MKTISATILVVLLFVMASCNSLPEPWSNMDLPLEYGEVINKSEKKLYVDYEISGFEGLYNRYDEALKAKGFKITETGPSHRPNDETPYINYIYKNDKITLSLVVGRYEDMGITAVMLDVK